MTDKAVSTIAELARDFGVTARTIRFYEAEGMISPERQGSQRLYHPRDRVRLKLILRGKRLGFSLAEIREIIDLYDSAPGERGQLDFFLDMIEKRRVDLEQKRRDIDLTLSELAEVERNCRNRLSELAKGREQA
ncbi:MerR family DNA-binding transcriptional regulator [Rhodospirillaceae bacterium KN72]|uniref:MerR family DNA-binding transcriptional regulator n=1 Tax=Pacificispira spongiicola TaxID=2729598 RepID=A0A7Y0E3N7_9PROT|nr:MerR family DNA-binding transcriptional regulator [Pacificispira spongiicola]NMM46631.1 MerR family DNA-binding transcriptional regulator [Pacificispira spongiicola]